MGPLTIARTPTDIFPNINIPVVTDRLELRRPVGARRWRNRIVSIYERNLTTTVNDIEHVESQSLRGIADREGVLPAGRQHRTRRSRRSPRRRSRSCASCRRARSRRSSSRTTRRACRSCSSALSGKGLSEQQLFDIARQLPARRSWPRVHGAQIPYPYGGKQPQIQVDLDPAALQAKGLTPADVVNAISAAEPDPAGRHVEDRRRRIRRRSERQPTTRSRS